MTQAHEPTRCPIVLGNWKMNGSSALLDEVIGAALAQHNMPCELVFCVPYPYLAAAQDKLAHCAYKLGAQDVSLHAKGAYTGEVSGQMLHEMGCSYVIVGHSERRAYHKESNQAVADKACRVMENGMVPVVCVGETLAQREGSDTLLVISEQLNAFLSQVKSPEQADFVVAYEPVWAIGTGLAATVEQIEQVHVAIREQLTMWNKSIAKKIRIVYGGSVKPDNAGSILSIEDVDGALVGGASLKACDFLNIGREAR